MAVAGGEKKRRSGCCPEPTVEAPFAAPFAAQGKQGKQDKQNKPHCKKIARVVRDSITKLHREAAFHRGGVLAEPLRRDERVSPSCARVSLSKRLHHATTPTHDGVQNSTDR
jgi:hypothetical protein